MANSLDSDAGSELFGSYEAELKLIQADLDQKLDQIPDLSGEPREKAIRDAGRALQEANEMVRPYCLCHVRQPFHVLTTPGNSLTPCA